MNIKEFVMDYSITSKSAESESDTLYIEGIANTGELDLVGDKLSQQALEAIVAQAPNRNLHLNHDTEFTGILGTIVESELRDEGAWIKASIISEHRDMIRSYLEQGVKMGLSISGTCTYEDNSVSDVIDWNLTEVSLTDIPCDQLTMGTVQISSKNITQVIKNIKEETRMAEETTTASEPLTEEAVITIINDAINERKDELLETIREEIKGDAADLVARVEAIEAQLEEKPSDEEKPEEEESKADAEEEEEKPEDEEEEKPKAETEEEEDKPEDEEEDKKAFEEAVSKAVDAKIKSIFGDLEKSASYKYESPKAESQMEKTSYTPAEIAKMI